jgi:activator of 2-hydroxyglutaryl-CoA dehydratase
LVAQETPPTIRSSAGNASIGIDIKSMLSTSSKLIIISDPSAVISRYVVDMQVIASHESNEFVRRSKFSVLYVLGLIFYQ